MPITKLGPLTCCTDPSGEKSIECCDTCGTPAGLNRRVKRIETDTCGEFKSLDNDPDLSEQENIDAQNAYYRYHTTRYLTTVLFRENYGPASNRCGAYYATPEGSSQRVLHKACFQSGEPQGHDGCCIQLERTRVRSRSNDENIFGGQPDHVRVNDCISNVTEIRNDGKGGRCQPCQHASEVAGNHFHESITYSQPIQAGNEIGSIPFRMCWSDESSNFLDIHSSNFHNYASTIWQNFYNQDQRIRKQKAYCCIKIDNLLADKKYTWEITVAEFKYVVIQYDFRGNDISSQGRRHWTATDSNGDYFETPSTITGEFLTDEDGKIESSISFYDGKDEFNVRDLPDIPNDEDGTGAGGGTNCPDNTTDWDLVWHELPFVEGRAYSTINQTYQYVNR